MLSCCERSRFTRRTATVTTSAPEASMARCIVSASGYFPVPTSRRDWKVRPAIMNGVSRSAPPALVISSASDEVHQLDRVARGHAHLAQAGAANDLPVVLDHHGARVELEHREQFEERGAGRYAARRAVHHDVDGR